MNLPNQGKFCVMDKQKVLQSSSATAIFIMVVSCSVFSCFCADT